jgi:hypothetical protein
MSLRHVRSRFETRIDFSRWQALTRLLQYPIDFTDSVIPDAKRSHQFDDVLNRVSFATKQVISQSPYDSVEEFVIGAQ